MPQKKNVIEFAEQRMTEEVKQQKLGADNEGLIRYWAAYLDGAKAQRKEFEKKPSIEEATIKFLRDFQEYISRDAAMIGLLSEDVKDVCDKMGEK